MLAVCREFTIETSGHTDILDITPEVTRIVQREGLREGLATVFVPGSTASISTIEFEEGALADLREALSRMAPASIAYLHDRRWGDGNGFSHVRAALHGPSLTLPITGGKPVLGTWQQIVLLDHDNGPRTRRIAVQLLGEA
jgi:secondary thiamine-phosphate synthase enzyme